jgi:recombination protein RecA
MKISKPFARLIRAANMQEEPIGTPTETKRDWWALDELSGRLIELSGIGATAPLTMASTLVLEAQRSGLPVAWISATAHSFYPPDMADNGIDLEALPVIWALDAASSARAADWLIRSSCFGLVIMDLGEHHDLPAGLQSRLVQLARLHDTALVCLTTKAETLPSLGSIVSLRGQVVRERLGPSTYACRIQVLKDKRKGPGWKHTEVCHGPAGLR